MIHSAYECNDLLPNMEMLLFKMFTSPSTTKTLRKDEDNNHLLIGNLFARDGVQLSSSVYRSLLETLALHPKKKHYKKIIEHMLAYADKQALDGDLLDLAVYIGVEAKYPVYLGQTMKFWLQNDFNVSVATFKKFVLFLEKCKGFEEDAKRFVILTGDTSQVQCDYELLRPLFLRAIKHKTG